MQRYIYIMFVTVILFLASLVVMFSNQIDKLQHTNAQLQQETVELKETVTQDWEYINTLQQTIYDLNKLSEQYEEERDAIQTKYAKLHRQLQRALSSSNCANEPLPINVTELLRQFENTTNEP